MSMLRLRCLLSVSSVLFIAFLNRMSMRVSLLWRAMGISVDKESVA